MNLVVEAVGSWPTIVQSLDLVRPGGTVCLVGEHSGKVDAAPLASHTFPLDQLRVAYDLFGAGEALKVLVEP